MAFVLAVCVGPEIPATSSQQTSLAHSPAGFDQASDVVAQHCMTFGKTAIHTLRTENTRKISTFQRK